jgi:hypothetical protein
MSEPSASGQIEIKSSPEDVYRIVSDVPAMVELAEETASFAWLDGATAARVGARFRGRNRRGLLRWSTICTITDLDEGSRFAFDVKALGFFPVARWQYDIEASGDGCLVTESTWDKRPGWSRAPLTLATSGSTDRAAINKVNITRTLERLKSRAESAVGA